MRTLGISVTAIFVGFAISATAARGFGIRPTFLEFVTGGIAMLAIVIVHDIFDD